MRPLILYSYMYMYILSVGSHRVSDFLENTVIALLSNLHTNIRDLKCLCIIIACKRMTIVIKTSCFNLGSG